MPDGLFANPLHWAILIVVVLIIFGPSKLPGVGTALGQSLREFRKASQAGPKQPTAAALVTAAAASAPVPQRDSVACADCGATNPANAQHCDECGVSLEKDPGHTTGPGYVRVSIPVCGHCQTENPASNRFCAHCGRLLDVVAGGV